MKPTFISTFCTLLLFQFGIAQNIKGKIIDTSTGEAIPYANIKVNTGENLVSNGEGFFSLSESNSQDETALTVSYLGFVNRHLTVSEMKKLDFTIKLTPAVYELNDVAVSNIKPNPYEIMANVKANLERNYNTGETANKDKLFYRKSENFKPVLIDVAINPALLSSTMSYLTL